MARRATWHSSWEMLVIGSSIHLWYLPFAFMMALVAWVATFSFWNAAPWPVILASAVLGCAILFTEHEGAFYVPISQWRYAMASLPLGFALGQTFRLPAGTCRIGVILVTAAICSVCAAIVWHGNSTGLSYGIAVFFVGMALFLPQYPHPAISYLSSLTLGIYILHPFVYLLLVAAIRTLPQPALGIAGMAIGSCLIAAALKRIPWMRDYI